MLLLGKEWLLMHSRLAADKVRWKKKGEGGREGRDPVDHISGARIQVSVPARSTSHLLRAGPKGLRKVTKQLGAY